MNLTRRKFIAGSLAGVGALGAGSAGLRYVSKVMAQPSGRDEVYHINSTCVICVSECVFRGQVVNGVIKRLEPEPDFPKSRGMMCARGNAGAATPYDPNRIKSPMIRTGKRGEGKWRKASWDEAYRYIAEKVNRVVEEEGGHRSCIAFASTKGTFQEHYYHQFRELFGSPNAVRHPTLCLSSVIRGFMSVFGSYPIADVRNSQYLILAGADRAESILTPDTIDLFKRRAGSRKLIYLDPRFTKTAALADQWLPIKPGSDMAFALAMIHVIIGENLHNRDFIDKHCVGFAELAEHVKQYTPEWAAKETDIAADTIRQVAREFATTPGAVWYPGRRTSWQGNEVQTRRAIALVNAVVGAFDRPGGLIPPRSAPLRPPFYEPVWYTKVRPRLEDGDVMFMAPGDGAWIPWRDRALRSDPYAIRGLFMYKQNVLEAVPDRNKTLELFAKLDIIVSIDPFMSSSAWYSDVVLPESTYLERLDPPAAAADIFEEPVVFFRQPLIKPLYDTKSCFDIMKELAAHFNDEDGIPLSDYFAGDIKSHTEYTLAPYPGALERLREKGFFTTDLKFAYGEYLSGKKKIATASGKIELHSEDFARRGLDPLPIYHRPKDLAEGQFRFLVGRHAIHTHSSTAGFPDLNWHMPENAVWINPISADKLGIKTGDLVLMKNRTGGEVKIKALVTEGIRPDCVYYANGFDSLSPDQTLVYGRGASQAAILESHFEPISGSALMHETIVEIRRA